MFDKNIAYNNLPFLPWKFNYEDSKILKLALKASEEISKLNGVSHIMPNLDIFSPSI